MIRIRNLAERDLDGLSGLIIHVYRDSPAAMHFDREPSSNDLAVLFAAKLQGMQDGKVADLVAVSGPIEDESMVGEAEVVASGDGTGYIGIIVRKEHRQKGLGSRLLEKACKEAIMLGISELRAEVSEGNNLALGFFSRFGFKEAGRIHAGPRSAVLLKKVLQTDTVGLKKAR